MIAPVVIRAVGAAVLLAALFGHAAAARADTIFTPYVGRSFGPDDSVQAETLGVAIASMAGGVFGFETDYARIADAPDSSVFADQGRVTTLFGNILIALPFGPARPYIAGGLGWLRAEAADQETDGMAVGAGGGVMGFLGGRIGARLDLRYIRGVTTGDGLRDFQLNQIGFWRTSVGLAFRF